MSRKRSPNFSEAELEILIDGVERNCDRFYSANYPTHLQTPPKVKYGKLYAAKLIQQTQRDTNAPLRSFVKNGQLIRAV